MSSKIYRYNDVSLDEINFSKPEKVGSSYFSSISYGETLKPLYIQTCRLKCLTDIDEIKDKKNPMIEVELTNGNYDLYDFFLTLDDKNIKKTFTQSKEWFSRELPLDAIDDMYKRTTKPFKKNANPVLKLKLPVIKNKIECTVYNQNKVFIDIDELKKNKEMIFIIHIKGLKILKQYFYCDCYITQIKVFQENSNYNLIKDYSLLDDHDEIDIEYDEIFDEEIKTAFKEESDEDLKRKEEEDLKRKEEEDLKRKEEEEKSKKIKGLQESLRKTQMEIDELIN